MKLRKNTLKIMGLLAGAGLCGSIYVIIVHKHQDKLARTLIDELNKQFNPSSTGIATEEAFDTAFAEELSKKIKGVLTIKPELATKYARDINNAWGFLNDDEDKVYAVFRSLRDKVQVSQVAKAYRDAYKVNLIDKLRSKLSDSEIAQVLKIVNVLPRYRV